MVERRQSSKNQIRSRNNSNNGFSSSRGKTKISNKNNNSVCHSSSNKS